MRKRCRIRRPAVSATSASCRAVSSTRLSGDAAARLFAPTAEAELFSATALSEAMRTRLVSDGGGGQEAQLVVLSGERSRDGSDGTLLPLDRAPLAYDGKRWRAIPFAQLLSTATGSPTKTGSARLGSGRRRRCGQKLLRHSPAEASIGIIRSAACAAARSRGRGGFFPAAAPL